MLTFDPELVPVQAGQVVADIGAGQGRHTYFLYRQGATVIPVDLNGDDLADVQAMSWAVSQEEQLPTGAAVQAVRANALQLPFPDDALAGIVMSETLEHIPQDNRALAEAFRVLQPGGWAVFTVPTMWPEQLCWWLDDQYSKTPGGHVRIYVADIFRAKVRQAGFTVTGTSKHHALHSPYWWLKCARGINRPESWLVRQYHRMLVWDLMKKPALTQKLEAAANPILGKSIAVYAQKADR